MKSVDYRIKSIGARVLVDNEKNLYTGYIRRLEIELELAHEREKRLLDELLRAKSVDRRDTSSEEQVPVNNRMSFREAARRVQEFERKQREELKDNSEDIVQSIDENLNPKSEGQGYAI